jgi:hypothetical protein
MKNIILFLFLVLTCSACDDFLDVKPTGTLIPETVEDYDKLLNDVLMISKGPENMVYMDPDNYMPGKNYKDLYFSGWKKQYTWADDHYPIETNDLDWNDRYRQIHVYNEIIDNIDVAALGMLSESKRDLIKGEAYTQRAFDYFLLINEYAAHISPATMDEPGVPLSLKADLTASLSRETVGAVYNQILNDLEKADALMKDAKEHRSDANFRPGRAALKALRAFVYLFMNDPSKALIYSNTALGMYDFLYDFKDIQHSTAGNPWEGFSYDNGAVERFLYFGTDSKSYLYHRWGRWRYQFPCNLYHPSLAALFDKDKDRRFTLMSSRETDTGIDISPNFSYARGANQNCVGISVANLILVNAESKVRTGDGEGAVAMLNMLREKRFEIPYTPLVHVDDATTLQWVKEERRRELAFTGLNLFDLKRYHAYGEQIPTFTRVVDGVTYTLEPGSSKYIVPISRKVKSFNPNL